MSAKQPCPAYNYYGHVTDVKSGNQVVIAVDLGFHLATVNVHCRLQDVETPDPTDSDKGISAREHLHSLLQRFALNRNTRTLKHGYKVLLTTIARNGEWGVELVGWNATAESRVSINDRMVTDGYATKGR